MSGTARAFRGFRSPAEVILWAWYLQFPVSYRDLDLSTEAGRKILRHRVALTARYLCGKLGESDTSPGVVPSCRQAAVTDAMKRVGTIEEGFAPRGTAWVVPPAWAPPYPADWDTRYPG